MVPGTTTHSQAAAAVAEPVTAQLVHPLQPLLLLQLHLLPLRPLPLLRLHLLPLLRPRVQRLVKVVRTAVGRVGEEDAKAPDLRVNEMWDVRETVRHHADVVLFIRSRESCY